MYRHLPREYIIVFCIILFAVALSMSQTILYRLQVPKGFIYPYVHNFAEDYYYYLHIMRQGWEGNWLATSRFTAEQFPPQFVVFWLVLLGHIARIFHISLPIAYTLARAFGAFLLFTLVSIVLQLLWPASRLKRAAGLLFVFFGTYWWGWGAEGPVVAPLVRAWTALDPLFRGSYIPHHLWSKIFMSLSFLFIVRASKGPSYLSIPCIILSVFLMGFASPVSLLPFFFVITLWGIYEINWKHQGCNRHLIVSWGMAVAAAILIAIYHVMIAKSVFPWTTYKAWEETMRVNVTLGSYVQAIGPAGILFFFGFPRLFRQSQLGRMMVIWAFVPFVELFIIGRFLPLSTIRFLDNYEFIPLGIGAVEGIHTIVSRFANPNTKTYRILLRLFLGAAGLYFAVGIIASWNQQARYIEANAINELVYIPKDYISAFQFIENQTAKESVVLSPYSIGTMIPAFTGKRVVAGHTLMTRDSMNKQIELRQIYEQRDSDMLREVIKRDNVSYIWLPSGNRLIDTIASEGYTHVYYNARVVLFSTKKYMQGELPNNMSILDSPQRSAF